MSKRFSFLFLWLFPFCHFQPCGRLKLLVICLTLTQIEMSGLFLAATRDSQPWPSYAPGFLNIQLECGEVVAVFVRKEAYVYMCS